MSAPHPVPAPLTPSWAFVVQLRAGCSFEPAKLCGRVEHGASGKASNLDFLESMRLFMRFVLTSRAAARASRPARSADVDGPFDGSRDGSR